MKTQMVLIKRVLVMGTLQVVSAQTANDSLEIKALLQVARAQAGLSDSTFISGQQALELARNNNIEDLVAEAYFGLAWSHYMDVDMERALLYADSAMLTFEKLKIKRGIARCLGFYALTLGSYGETERAIEKYEEARATYAEIENLSGVANMTNNLGVLYNETGRYQEGLQEHGKTNLWAKQLLDTLNLARSHYNYGISLQGLDRPEQAFYHYDTSYHLRLALGIKRGIVESLIAMARSLVHLHQQGYSASERTALLGQEPFQLLERAERGLREFPSPGLTIRLQEAKVQYYTLTGDFEAALHAQQLIDSIKYTRALSERNLASFTRLRDRLEKQEQESQIIRLEHENQLEKVAGEKRMLERNLLFTMLLGVLVVTLLAFRFWRVRLRNTQMNLSIKEMRIRQLDAAKELEVVNALMQGSELERERIAAELHDSVGNLLSTAKLELVHAQQQGEDIDRVLSIMTDTHREVRDIAHNLMPVSFRKLGLVRAVQELVRRQNAVGKTYFKLDFPEHIGGAASEGDMMLYRIIQELVQNIQKHANASEATISVLSDDQHLQLVVSDDGQGWNPQAQSSGMGMRNLEARIKYLRGNLELQAAPGMGCTYTIQVPREMKHHA